MKREEERKHNRIGSNARLEEETRRQAEDKQHGRVYEEREN